MWKRSLLVLLTHLTISPAIKPGLPSLTDPDPSVDVFSAITRGFQDLREPQGGLVNHRVV